jgi:glycosyltransferase involved in cell wall biosynthesis
MDSDGPNSFEIIIPAKNEARGLSALLPALIGKHPGTPITVINDGSTDNTEEICDQNNVRVLSHPYSMGNGAAIKTGARHATRDVIVFMDADGQHDPQYIGTMIEMLGKGYDMVVGARSSNAQANVGRSYANKIYNRLASWIVGKKIADLTSGFRAVNTKKFREFLYLLPNGFSYPTTITMAFFRAGYVVGYTPIEANKRQGRSHIRPLRDGFRFFLIIFRVGTLYSPLKLFVPVSFTFFCMGWLYYSYTYIQENRFTNMSALLLSTSVIIFLIGLVSEQITSLIYNRESNTP